jgi:hypothetical protein
MARIRAHNRYYVRSTKESNKLPARQVAIELRDELLFKAPAAAPPQFLFKSCAHRLMNRLKGRVERGELNANYVRTVGSILDNKEWGLLKEFGERDVRTLKTTDYNAYMEKLTHSASTRSYIRTVLRMVHKVAREDDPNVPIPDIAAVPRDDNPRPMFWFKPIVDDSEYEKLLFHARRMGWREDVVKNKNGTLRITTELYNLIQFATGSFLRPTKTELFGLRHRHVEVPKKGNGLILTIPKGKTGFRLVHTLERAKIAYIEQHALKNPKPDDFVWFNEDGNDRTTTTKKVGAMFNYLLDRAQLKVCPKTGLERTLYSLRHTAISMRLYDAPDLVFLLAKNAGTSVEMIERFYAKHLPLGKEIVAKFQGNTTEEDRQDDALMGRFLS